MEDDLIENDTGRIELYDFDRSDGCSDQTILEINPCSGDFPNIITPNGDFTNDAFRLRLPDVEFHDLFVYNRWGKLVYQQESYDNAWTAKNLIDGVYYYRIVHQTELEEYTG